MKLLLERRADPRIQDINGATSAHYSVLMKHYQALVVILDAGRKNENFDVVTVRDVRGKSAVDYARKREREEIIKLLQNKMGGSYALLWQIFKGWCCDKTG